MSLDPVTVYDTEHVRNEVFRDVLGLVCASACSGVSFEIWRGDVIGHTWFDVVTAHVCVGTAQGTLP